jgi:hypothetical protein
MGVGGKVTNTHNQNLSATGQIFKTATFQNLV